MKTEGCFEVRIWLFWTFGCQKLPVFWLNFLGHIQQTIPVKTTGQSVHNCHFTIQSHLNQIRLFVRSSQQTFVYCTRRLRSFASHAGSLVCFARRLACLFVCSSVRLFVCSSDKFNTAILSSNHQTKLNLQILQITTSFEQSGFLILVLLVFINIVKP